MTIAGLAGHYATETDAFKAAIRKFGRATPFYIAPVTASPEVAEVPALALGLIGFDTGRADGTVTSDDSRSKR